MILIVGGRASGKGDFAAQELGVRTVAKGGEDSIEDIMDGQWDCLRDVHLLVRRLMAEGRDPLSFMEELFEKRPEGVFITDEIGCGIVPVEKEERLWRENAGRCGCMAAARAEKVVRLICGTAVYIKGER